MIDDDHVDKSQWVEWSKNDPMLKPERAAKGDVVTGPDCGDCGATGKDKMTKTACRACKGRGWVGTINAAMLDSADVRFAQVHEVNLLNRLWSSGQITDQQHHDGQTFRIWRDMHRVQMGTEKPVCALPEGDEVFGVRLRAYGYILLIRKLNRFDLAAVETSLIPMTMSWADWVARNRLERYVTAFGRLSGLLPAVRDQIAYLESLSDEQRDESCKDGIKKLLDVIKRQ